MVINMLDYFPCRRWLNLLGTRDRRRRGASSARINIFILKQQLPAWHTAAARNRNENLVLKIFKNCGKHLPCLSPPQLSVQPLRGRQPKGLSSNREWARLKRSVGDEPRPVQPAIINAD